MREYTKTSPAIWQSRRFWALKSDEDRFCYLYLLTNQHQNSCGCYALPDGYAAVDLRWDIARYRQAIAALVLGEMIRVDSSTEEILIERWFSHNAPMNEKHRIGTARLVERIQSDDLRAAAQESLEKAWADAMRRRESKQRADRPASLLPIRGVGNRSA